jgi:hypothetical protein
MTSDSALGLRKMKSVMVVVAMIAAGLVAVFAIIPTNVVAAQELVITGTDIAPAVGVFPGDNNITMLWLSLNAPEDALDVYSLTFDITGTVVNADVEKIFLFDDYNGDGEVSQTEIANRANDGILATQSSPTFPQTLTLSSYTINPASYRYILVFIDITTGTETETVGLDITGVSSDDAAPVINNPSSGVIDIKYVIWSDEMEGGAGNWVADGTPSVLWHMTQYWCQIWESPTNCWWYGDEAARNYATGVTRNYGNLTSEAIDLSGYSGPALSFWQDITTENFPGYDEGRLFIEDQASPGVWTEEGLWRLTQNYSKAIIDLAPYAGKSIKIRFNFDTTDGTNNIFRGWNIDRMYFYGGQEANDVATQDFSVQRFAQPLDNVYVNATVFNLGQGAEDNATNGIDAWLRIDGSYDQVDNIPSLAFGGSQAVSFIWTPTSEGDYEVCIHTWPVVGETSTADNLACDTVQVRNEPSRKIVVVRSYGTKSGLAIDTWQDLMTNWESYGVTPLELDWDSLNKTAITYADIVASGADVLVVSASATLGTVQAWSELTDAEVSAIKQYVLEGHGFVSTASAFRWDVPKNNNLTELVGIVDQPYDIEVIDANTNLDKLNPGHVLFTNVAADPFTIGNPMSSVPQDDWAWNASDLRPGSLGGQYLAMSSTNNSTLVEFKRLVYFSWIPERLGNAVDKQILYNALAWSEYQTVPHDVAMSNLIGPTRVKPSPTMDITATITNLASVVEDNGAAGIDIHLTEDGAMVDQTNIPSLGVGASQDVTLVWDPPDLPVPNTYNICMKALPVLGETDTTNNEVCMNIDVIDQNIIIVAILDSWGTDNPGLAPWDDINLNWATYGPHEVLIDYTMLDKEDITLLDLVYSGADVLLISTSNSSGLSTAEFTLAEITAIQTYVQALDHNIMATGLTFDTVWLPNNNQLTPLFGMDSLRSYTNTTAVTDYTQLVLGHTVFYRMPSPDFTTASGISCVPGAAGIPDPNGWDASILMPDAYYLGNSVPSPPLGGIVNYTDGSYRALFLSNAHEIASSGDDKQILYNSMVWAAGRTMLTPLPPNPPQDLWIYVQGTVLELDWIDTNPAADVWYNIYRALAVDTFNFGIPYDQVAAPPWLDVPGTATDTSNYFYVVRAINTTSLLMEYNTVKVGKFYSQLHRGTNDISIPFELQFPAVDIVFGPISADITEVSIFDSASAMWQTWPGPIFDVDNTMGIRVFSTRNNLDFVTVGRVPVDTPIDLMIGASNWFFVGYPCFNTYPLPDILDDNGLAGLYILVYHYDPTDRKSPWKWFDPNDPNSPLTDFETGKGYWIYMNASGTWTVPGE